MNAVWCFFNIVILGVCTAVAREMKQLRSNVRIDVAMPVVVRTPDGRMIAGETVDMSFLRILYVLALVMIRTGARRDFDAMERRRKRAATPCSICSRICQPPEASVPAGFMVNHLLSAGSLGSLRPQTHVARAKP